MSSLRDRLRSRVLATAAVAIPRDPVSYARAEQALEVATRALQVATSRGVAAQHHQDAVDAAQVVVEAEPVEVFTISSLPATVWETLVEAHPPTDEQRRNGWQWNVAGFRPALLAATVQPPTEGEAGLTELDWRQLTDEGQFAVGELDLLFVTAVNLHTRQPQVSTGKG